MAWPASLSPNANAASIAAALATIGYSAPASSLPVVGELQPVLVVGGISVPAFKSQTGSIAAPGAGVWSGAIFTVPAGYQWRITRAQGTVAAGAANLAVLPNGGVLPATANALVVAVTPFQSGTSGVLPFDSTSVTGQPWEPVECGPGDQIGVVGGTATNTVYLTIWYEEFAVPYGQ